jgi:hypothetical protein
MSQINADENEKNSIYLRTSASSADNFPCFLFAPLRRCLRHDRQDGHEIRRRRSRIRRAIRARAAGARFATREVQPTATGQKCSSGDGDQDGYNVLHRSIVNQ